MRHIEENYDTNQISEIVIRFNYLIMSSLSFCYSQTDWAYKYFTMSGLHVDDQYDSQCALFSETMISVLYLNLIFSQIIVCFATTTPSFKWVENVHICLI